MRSLPSRLPPQGEIDVALQSPAQSDVPPAPEDADAFGLVGGAEIEGNVDIEELSQAHGHIGIAAEIEIDLEGIGQGCSPGGPEAQAGCPKARVRKQGQRVCNHGLFK